MQDDMAKNFFPIILMVFFLTSCSDTDVFAPVVEPKWQKSGGGAQAYVVRRGDTLYSIAFRYDLDYQTLAAYNHLRSPYTVRIGQMLRLTPPGTPMRPVQAQPMRNTNKRPIPVVQPLVVSPSRLSNAHWMWPARGKVVANFAPQRGVKGIDISGKRGDKIYAASNGVVAYSGNGLARYGNLIIIKHNNQFMTAYGNNLRNVVREGQTVQKGQVIAEMGMMNRHYWGVHFEIRQLGKPVNPLSYLPH